MGNFFSTATRGNFKSQIRRNMASSSRSLSFPSESCGGPDHMAVDVNKIDNMVCDKASPVLASNSIAEKQENCTPVTITAASIEKEAISMHAIASTFTWPLSNQIGFRQPNFTDYALSVLNSSSVGGESIVIPDTVRFALINVVRLLEDSNAEVIRATSLERTVLVKAHEEKMSQLVAECKRGVAVIQLCSDGKMKELNCSLEKASKEHTDALCQLSGVRTTLTTSQSELQDCKKQVLKLQSEVKEKTVQIAKLNTTQKAKAAEMEGLKREIEKLRRLGREATEVSAKEVQRLMTNISKKEKSVDSMISERTQLTTKCQKLESQLALIEQKTAQDSLNSGSYADDHANPSMLQEIACKSVDKAANTLATILHDNSITKSCPLNSKELERFVSIISLASPVDFSRTFQVKHIWSHWMCFIMFQGFEHSFFDVDDGQLTSPLDAKSHASICFQSFQQEKDMPSKDLYLGCDLFRAFCTKKYIDMFPPWLSHAALPSNFKDENIFNVLAVFGGNDEFFRCFLDVAKAVWLLHELAFSFDPPASILRMAHSTAFDKLFHESVIHDEDRGGSAKVVLMIRPGFRVRNTIIRSRVFLSMK